MSRKMRRVSAILRSMTMLAALTALLIAGAMAGRAGSARAEQAVLADFEKTGLAADGTLSNWELKDAATKLVLTTDPQWVSEGQHALLLSVSPTKDKNRAMLQLLTQAANWSNVTGLYADIYNPMDQSVDLIFAVQTANWNWQEFAAITLDPGWNRDVSIPFEQPFWKSAATGWQYSAKLTGKEEVNGINFLFVIYDPGEYTFAIDNIRIERS